MLGFLVLQDYKENRRKCTVEPLCGTIGVDIVRLPKPRAGAAPFEVPHGIVLDVDAPQLSRGDVGLVEDGGSVVALDATWARLEALRRQLRFPAGGACVPRSLPTGVVSAYPRVSKVFDDPPTGLATVEALYVAGLILGEPRPELLIHFRWREEFLARNDETLRAFGGSRVT